MSHAVLGMCKAWIRYVSIHMRRCKNICKELMHNMRCAHLLQQIHAHPVSLDIY